MSRTRKFVGIGATLSLLVIGGWWFATRPSIEETPVHELSWRQARTVLLPQFLPRENAEKLPFVRMPFSPDLDIGFVIDRLEKYEFVMQSDQRRWEVKTGILYEQAIENLMERSENLDLSLTDSEIPTGKYITLELADGYSAVRVLLPAIRRRVARELNEPFVAAIPTRDFLIFWPQDFSLHDAFAEQVRKEFETGQRTALTPEIFRLTTESMEVVVEE